MRKLRQDRVRLIRALESNTNWIGGDDYQALMQIINFIRRDVDGYLSISKTDRMMVSYARTPDDKYDSGRRVRTTLQRYIRRTIGIDQAKLPDHILDRICQPVFAKEMAECADKFTILRGDDVVQAYLDEVGGESCMTGGDGKVVELYGLNPDKVGMLVYDGEARALVWNTDEGVTVLDRVYPHGGIYSTVMEEYARLNGWVWRTGGSDYDGMTLSDGNYYKVTVKWNEFFPYMDTFKWATVKGKQAILSNGRDSYDYVLDCTDGGPIHGINHLHCEACGDRISEDDTYWGYDAPYCRDCFDDMFTNCDRCGEAVHNEDTYIVQGEWWCECCFDRRAFLCEKCGESFPNTAAFEVGGMKYCKYCWCGLDKCDNCEEAGELNECSDGVLRCNNCCSECSECEELFSNDDLEEGKCEDCATKDKPE